MTVLVVNTGSSSLKFACFHAQHCTPLLRGHLSEIGTANARLTVDSPLGDGPGDASGDGPGDSSSNGRGPAAGAAAIDLREVADLEGAVAWLTRYLANGRVGPLTSVGHRVVHGGSRFTDATLIDDVLLRELEALDDLAPLHNPASRRTMAATLAAFPDLPQVAVFDTAFHATLPEHAHRYALPDAVLRDSGVRRFGFHGTSYRYLVRRTAELLERPIEDLRLIILHLGNGASVAAVRGGRSIDTSMGFSPLEGLMMGTRCGDLDASVPIFLQAQLGLAAAAVGQIMNEESGLLAVAGVSDMREIERRRRCGDHASELAFDMFCYRARKYLGAYLAVLGGADAVVFSGGIGQHSAAVRAQICSDLTALGVDMDPSRNAEVVPDDCVHAAASRTAIAVLATDEELQIARETLARLERRIADP